MLLLACAHLFNNESKPFFSEECAPKNIDRRPIWKGKRLTIPRGCRLYISTEKSGELRELQNPIPEEGALNLDKFYFVCVAANISSAQRKYQKFMNF